MRCYAWCNERGPLIELLLASARAQGIALELLGMGKPYESLLCKLEWLGERVRRLPEEELVLCTDAYDVLYLQKEEVIEQKFRGLGGEIVCAAERWYKHQSGRRKRVFDCQAAPFGYRYVNSGTVAGYAGALARMLEAIECDRRVHARMRNDQWFVGKYYCDHPSRIQLDYRCELFWCTAGEWDQIEQLAEVAGGELTHTITGTKPAVVHVPFRQQHEAALVQLARRLGLTGSRPMR